MKFPNLLRRLQDSPAAWAILGAAAVFVQAAATGLRDIGWSDSAEIALAARTWSIMHPPGYPWYTLLAGAAWRLPYVGGYYGISLLSALGAALAAGLWTRIAVRLGAAPHVACACALALAWGVEMRHLSAIPEVYTWHAAIVALLFDRLLVWREKGGAGPFVQAALVWGLGFAHHPTMVWTILPGAAFILYNRRLLPRKVHWWVAAALCFAAGPAFYLYLPWRAQAPCLMNFGDPSDWPKFIDHVTGAMFRYRFHPTDPAESWARLTLFASSLKDNLPWAFWAGVIFLPLPLLDRIRNKVLRRGKAGNAATTGGDEARGLTFGPDVLITLILFAISGLAFLMVYIIPDPEGYYLLLHGLAGTAAAVGWGRLFARIAARTSIAPACSRLLPVAAGVLILAAGDRVDYSDDTSARDLTLALWRSAGQDSILIVQDLSLFYSTRLLQEERLLTPKSAAISQYLLAFPWYLDHIKIWNKEVVVPDKVIEGAAKDAESVRGGSGRGFGEKMRRSVEKRAQDLADANLAKFTVHLYRSNNDDPSETWGDLNLRETGLSSKISNLREPPAEPVCAFPAKYKDESGRSTPGAALAASRFATACNRKAIAIAAEGRTREAEEALLTALSFDPVYAAAWKNLGTVRVRGLKDVDGGRAAYQRYLDIVRDAAEPAIVQWMSKQKNPPITPSGP